MQISEAAVHEHHWFDEPTKPVGPKFISGIVFAQFVFFVALLGPAIIADQVPKVQRGSVSGLVGSRRTSASSAGPTSRRTSPRSP